MLPAAFACCILDHIHLNVPAPAAATSWYEKYFGARRSPEGPDRMMFGSTRLLFIKKADAIPVLGTGKLDLKRCKELALG